MQITSLFGNGNEAARLRKEAAETRKAIEAVAEGDAFMANGERQLLREQGELWRGQVNPQGMSAVKVEKGSTVVLREEIIKEDNRALQVAAAIAGTLVGGALFGNKKKGGSLGGALASLVLGGLAAWGAGKATDAIKEKRIERVETTDKGVSRERLSEGRNGTSYSNSFKRTAPADPIDPQAAKDYINNLKF